MSSNHTRSKISKTLTRTSAQNAAAAKEDPCARFRQRPSNRRSKIRAFGTSYDVRKDDWAICVCGWKKAMHHA